MTYAITGLDTLGSWILEGLKKFGEWIWSGMKWIAEQIGQGLTWAAERLKDFGMWIWNGLKWIGDVAWYALKAVYNFIMQVVNTITTTVKNWYSSVASYINQWFSNLVAGFRNKLKMMIIADTSIVAMWKGLEGITSVKSFNEAVLRVGGIFAAPFLAAFAAEMIDKLVPVPSSTTIELVPQFEFPEIPTVEIPIEYPELAPTPSLPRVVELRRDQYGKAYVEIVLNPIQEVTERGVMSVQAAGYNAPNTETGVMTVSVTANPPPSVSLTETGVMSVSVA